MGLFSSFGRIVLHQAVAGAALAGGLTVAGAAHAAVDAIVVALVTAVIALTTLVTTRSARAASTIDPDTGVPNSHGMAEHVDAMRAAGPVMVSVAHLQGVAEVGDALGPHVASELVRRAVEDLGQVLPIGVSIGRATDDDVLVVTPLGGDALDRRRQCEVVLTSITSAIGAGRYVVGAVEIALNTHVGSTTASPDEVIAGTELIRRAGLAAQRATAQGVAHSEWDGTTTTLTAHDLDLLSDLRHAFRARRAVAGLPAEALAGRGRGGVGRGAAALDQPAARRRDPVPVHPARRADRSRSTGSPTGCWPRRSTLRCGGAPPASTSGSPSTCHRTRCAPSTSRTA